MAENQPSLTPKELYEREREAKRRERDMIGSSSETGGKDSRRRIWPWFLAILILGGTVFGLYKLATLTPPGGAGTGVLADPITAADWTDGSQQAGVQLVEFGDFQCPACAFYAPWVTQLRTEFKNEIGVTFRHFPLRQNHQNAQLASQVAEAAGLQGKFWLAVDAIYDGQKTWADQLSARGTLLNLVRSTGVNMAKLEADLDSTVVKNKIEQHYQSGLRSGVGGTPTFYLNGKKIVNPKSYDEFKQLITDAAKG